MGQVGSFIGCHDLDVTSTTKYRFLLEGCYLTTQCRFTSEHIGIAVVVQLGLEARTKAQGGRGVIRELPLDYGISTERITNKW